jgi:hypothetical protein
MSSRVLTLTSTLTCPHTATLSLKPPEKLTVNLEPVITHKSVENATINCPKPPRTIASGEVPCTKILTVSKGATKLTIDNDPVLIDGLAITTNGTANIIVVVPSEPHKLFAT